MNIGDAINEMETLDAQIKERDKETKKLKEKRDDMQTTIMHMLNEMGIESARGLNATVTLTEEITANVEAWDVVYEYIKANEAWYLLPRRVLSAPYRELVKTTGEELPGIKPFVKKKLSLRRKQ